MQATRQVKSYWNSMVKSKSKQNPELRTHGQKCISLIPKALGSSDLRENLAALQGLGST